MLERRERGQRRWGFDIEFPLTDSDGTAVITERRRMSDRRLVNTSLEERLAMFSEVLPLEPEWHNHHHASTLLCDSTPMQIAPAPTAPDLGYKS